MSMYTDKTKKHKLLSIYAPLGMHPQNAELKIRRLQHIENLFHRHAVKECSEVLTDEEKENLKTKRRNAMDEVNEMLPLLAGRIHWNKDPRGYALMLSSVDTEDISKQLKLTTNWGGEYIIAPNAQ